MKAALVFLAIRYFSIIPDIFVNNSGAMSRGKTIICGFGSFYCVLNGPFYCANNILHYMVVQSLLFHGNTYVNRLDHVNSLTFSTIFYARLGLKQ